MVGNHSSEPVEDCIVSVSDFATVVVHFIGIVVDLLFGCSAFKNDDVFSRHVTLICSLVEIGGERGWLSSKEIVRYLISMTTLTGLCHLIINARVMTGGFAQGRYVQNTIAEHFLPTAIDSLENACHPFIHPFKHPYGPCSIWSFLHKR